MAAAAAATLPPPSSFFGAAQYSVLSPLSEPLAFAERAGRCALMWGGFSFLWQLGFERYAALLERRGYLQREAHEPTVPRAQMLWQSLFGIAGTALPSALVQAYLRPEWTFGVTPFGALALVPYVFLYVLLFDAYYYWGHRACHAHPLLYRLVHKRHHAPSASLSAGSTSYMSFLEGFLLSGLPFAPNILLPVLFLRGNFWVAGFNYLAILCLFYLGHTGCAIKKDILPVFLLNPYLIALGVTANACRPQDHTAHHDRVLYNYAIFFKIWDEVCGTAAPPAKIAVGGAKTTVGAAGGDENGDNSKAAAAPPPPPISWRVMLYNIANFFSFFALPLALAGAPVPFLAALAAWASGLLPFGAEAAVLRAVGLTGLVSRAPFWDALRRDLRVSVERDDGRPPPGTGATLVAVVSLPRPALSALLLAGKKGAGGQQREEEGRGGGGAWGGGAEARNGGGASPPPRSSSSSPLIRVRAHEEAAPRSYFVGFGPEDGGEHEQEEEEEAEEDSAPPPQPATPPAAKALLPPAAAAAAAAKSDGPRPQQPRQRACLYVYHPRGDLMRGAFFAFGARGRDPRHPLSAERDVRLALPAPVAGVLLRLPLIRELVALLGGVDPSSVGPALRSGASVAVCLPGPPRRSRRAKGGGEEEGQAAAAAAAAAPAEEPPAFVRAALASGAALVPVVGAGEAELAGALPLRDKMVMPSRPGRPVRVVFGEPVVAGEGESAQQLRARFAAALASLAARHGAPAPEAADV